MNDTVATGAASPGTSFADRIVPPQPNATTGAALDTSTNQPIATSTDLNWVWREVRKRVFKKLSHVLVVSDAMAVAIPVVFDGDNFVVGFEPKHYNLAHSLTSEIVRNTIENILREASGRPIHFEVMEGTTIAQWEEIKLRRCKAQAAVIALAEQQAEAHHFEDMMNQIVGEVRHHISQIHDRMLPQVRAALVLDVASSLADAEEALFAEANTRDGKRIMSRIIDRISTFLEVQPITLAIEVERARRAHTPRR